MLISRLAIAALLLGSTSAIAADNFQVIDANGVTITKRSKDTGSGIQSDANIILDTSYSPINPATQETLAALSAKLPASLGPKASASSLSVTPAFDAVFPVSISGTLPAFAATPTFNCGTGCLATSSTIGTTYATAGTAILYKDESGNARAVTGDFTSGAINTADLATKNAVTALGTSISAPDARPASGTITAQDTGSSSASGMNSVAIYSGTPTANSFLGYKPSTSSVTLVQMSGTWTGSLQFERAMDNTTTGGTLWQATSCHQQGTSMFPSAATGNGIFECETAGATGFRVRSIGSWSGTATVQFVFTPQSSPRNPSPQRLTDNAGTPYVIAAASAPITVSTATTTQIVPLSSGKVIYVTSFDVVAGGTGNITFSYGTGTNCGTGTAFLTGTYNLTAQSGIAKGSGTGPILVVPAGNALCVLTSAAVQMSGSVSYAQF